MSPGMVLGKRVSEQAEKSSEQHIAGGPISPSCTRRFSFERGIERTDTPRCARTVLMPRRSNSGFPHSDVVRETSLIRIRVSVRAELWSIAAGARRKSDGPTDGG